MRYLGGRAAGLRGGGRSFRGRSSNHSPYTSTLTTSAMTWSSAGDSPSNSAGALQLSSAGALPANSTGVLSSSLVSSMLSPSVEFSTSLAPSKTPSLAPTCHTEGGRQGLGGMDTQSPIKGRVLLWEDA